MGVVVIPSNAKSIKSIQDKDQAGIDRELEEVLGAFDVWLVSEAYLFPYYALFM